MMTSWLAQKSFDAYRWCRNSYLQSVNRALVGQTGYCGSNVNLVGLQRITGLSNLRLGENVGIGNNSFMRCEGGVVIGSHTRISRNLVLYTINHDFRGTRIPYDCEFIEKPVYIGKATWIGMNVTILPGAVIGEGSIVGAGCVVRGHIPPLSIAMGNPATVTSNRNEAHYRELRAEGKFGGRNGSEYTCRDDYDPLDDLEEELKQLIELL